MQFYQFRRSVKTLGRWEGREADKGTIRSLSSDLRLPISDIVKRKRIRLPEVGRRKSEDGSYPFSAIRPLSSVKQPVVGLEPDRSDPRMRLKQNWSFQRRRRLEIGSP
jgi:hypothetical protein